MSAFGAKRTFIGPRLIRRRARRAKRPRSATNQLRRARGAEFWFDPSKHGKPFAPDERMKKILVEAAAVGSATVRALAYRSRDPEAYIYPNSAWQTPFIGGSYEFLRDGARLLDARSFFFFIAPPINPPIALKNPGAGAKNLFPGTDPKRRPLAGGDTQAP